MSVFNCNVFYFLKVLWPACNVRDLHLWTEVYIGSLETDSNAECMPCSTQTDQTTTEVHSPPMTKTRSYGDLMGAAEPCPNLMRRSSDPNITLDTMYVKLELKICKVDF